MPSVAIIGAGPAGLMAAETLIQAGLYVDVYDAMPSVGRKFLMAGKGGMNITHAEPLPDFLSRYGAHATHITPWLQDFPPSTLRTWVHELGIPTFVGSSGRVFPTEMKAAPLLRAWLHRLRGQGVRIHVRHRWLDWHDAGAIRFATPNGEVIHRADATLLALGGGSWPQLGSDGLWTQTLARHQIAISPLRPANCGFELNWSEHFRAHFAGAPLKSVALSTAGIRLLGECLITQHGIEGGGIYTLSARLREAIEQEGCAILTLDLLPDWEPARVLAAVSHPRGSRSLSSHLKSRLGLAGIKANLLREVLNPEQMQDSALLARTIKALPLRLTAPRPLAEAISSAGGVCFSELDEGLMLRKLPGVFCAGEMLDWEAPTGGYLLTACLASGRIAGKAILRKLASQPLQ